MDIELMRRGAEAPEAATAANADGVAQDLADAFAADPLFDWFSRADSRRDAARRMFFRHLLSEMVFGVGEVLRPSTGGAAAIWMPSEALAAYPMIKELQGLPMLLGLTGWSRFMRMLQLREAMDRHHPMDRPHAYLWFLGVTPAAQGHGVGSRLIRAKTERLDAARRPAFLETATARNVQLYRRHGFEVVADYRPSPSGPMNWAMWRDPRKPS
ncbi:MAG TPA: GNAT family N-acetyltransferase [Caulobacteraceae bacterium]|jgi:ribosomal protein S18 acetylase RimI-like enzyme|nr:GNAT family N-acetyltransferase [Caulobacteraceae bacterium]